MEPVTVVSGERVKLVIPEERYFENVYKLWVDPETWRYSDDQPMIQSKEPFRKNFWEKFNDKGSSTLYLLIVRKNDNEFIGDIGAHFNPQKSKANLFIAITKEHRNRGYGKEAMQLFIKFLFDNYPLEAIVNYVYEFNEASIRLHEKLGFERVGKEPKTVFRFGKWWGSIIYALTREGYENLHNTRDEIR